MQGDSERVRLREITFDNGLPVRARELSLFVPRLDPRCLHMRQKGRRWPCSSARWLRWVLLPGNSHRHHKLSHNGRPPSLQQLESHGQSSQPDHSVREVVRRSLVELMEMVLDTPKSARNGLSIVLQLLTISIFEYAWVVDQALLEAVLERTVLMLVRSGSAETVRDVSGFVARVMEAMWRLDDQTVDDGRADFKGSGSAMVEEALGRLGVMLLDACDMAGEASARSGRERTRHEQRGDRLLGINGLDSTIGLKGFEQVISGLVRICVGVGQRVGTSAVVALSRRGIASGARALAGNDSIKGHPDQGPTCLSLVLELMLSPSRMIQAACLEFVDAMLRSPLVADDPQVRWAVVVQCRHALYQLRGVNAMHAWHGSDEDVEVYEKVASVLWTVWGCVDEAEEHCAQELRTEVLQVAERALLVLAGLLEDAMPTTDGPVGARMTSLLATYVTLFCDCVVDAPLIGIQFPDVFRRGSVLGANPKLHRRLLVAAAAILGLYSKEEISGYFSSLRETACMQVCDSDGAPATSAKKRRKMGGRGHASSPAPGRGATSNAHPSANDHTTGFSPHANPSSQMSSPSLSRLVKVMLVAIYRDLDALQQKFAECSVEGSNEGLANEMFLAFDKVLISLAFVAGRNRDVAAELIEDVANRIAVAALVQDVRSVLTVQLYTLTQDVCTAYSLNFADQVLERQRAALRVDEAGSFFDLFLGDLEVQPTVAMKVPQQSLDMAHFIPLVVLTQTQKRAPAPKSKPRKGSPAVNSLASSPQDFLLRVASVSPAASKSILVGIIVYLSSSPDVVAMFDEAREAVFFKQALCEGACAEGLGSLQPHESKVVADVLFELSKKYDIVEGSMSPAAGGSPASQKKRNEDADGRRERDLLPALIVQASIMGFHRASLTDSPSWRGLAKYVVHAVQSKGRAARALLSRLPVLKCESFVLALTVHKDHPISSKERMAASIFGENEVVKALQLELPKAIAEAAVFQNILVALEYCSTSMRNVNAVNLSLVILICHLESKDLVIAALAAQSLLGIAASKGQTLRDMLLQNDSLLEILGPRLPRKTDLLVELADLLGVKDRALLSACMSTILPSIWAKGGVEGVSGLAKQLGASPQQILLRHGEHSLTSSFLNKKPTMEEFLKVSRSIMVDGFDDFVTSITPRTLSELILEMGANQAWNSHQGSLPETLVELTSKSIAMLIGKLRTSEDGLSSNDVSVLLAQGDNVTRLLKHLGDKFDDHSAKDSKLKIIRGVIFLIRVTGKYVGRHLPQFLVLLSASIRRSAPVEVRVQGLIGFAYLVRSLASFAPLQLGSSSNQVAVALLDSLQTDGPVGDAAFKALEILVEQCRRLFPDKLRNLPPIPQCSNKLRELSANLMDDQNTVAEKVQSLLQGLQEESLDVRAVTLGELRNILKSQRSWVSTLIDPNRTSEDDSLLRDLISALVKSCSPEITSLSSITAQQVCAECLGILGALDPSRVRLNNSYEPLRYQPPLALAHDILINHLIKLLMTANSMSVLDRVTVSIQDVLKCDDLADGDHGARRKSRDVDKSNALFDSLPQDARAVVKPYLESRYSFGPLNIPKHGFIYHRKMRFRVWLGRWLVKMIHQSGKSSLATLYQALVPVVLFDVPTAMKIAPYVIVTYLDEAGATASKDVVGEILHVIDQNATPTSDGLSCMQAIFSLLDALNLWNEDQQYPKSFDWGILDSMTADIPRVKLAHAASTCGAHARYVSGDILLTIGIRMNTSNCRMVGFPVAGRSCTTRPTCAQRATVPTWRRISRRS